jgi:hypothetical protein
MKAREHGRADHCDPEGTRGWREDGRSVPQARDQRGELLQLEVQVRRAESLRGQASEGARERERTAKEAFGRRHARQRRKCTRRGGRKRALGTRAPMLVPQPNERWLLDFVADQFIDGRRLRILVVVDDCARQCLALIDRDRGKPRGSAPPTPPCVRVRTRRFEKLR